MHSDLTDSTLRLLFDGDILSTEIATLRPLLLGCLDSSTGVSALVADLSASKIVDSQGLNLLMALLHETERRKWTFRVENADPDLRRLFTVLNLNSRFGIGAVDPK